jgi:chaperonin GroES
MSIRPLGDHVLLRRLDTSKTTPGGILIPETAKETSQEAKVVAVGTGKRNADGVRIPTDLKKGDRVLVRRYAGTEVEIDGKEYLVVHEDEILGTIS